MTKQKTDAELVQESLQNPDQFGALMKRYETKLLRYIRRFTGVNRDEAEDILQEVFIKVYKNLNDFDPELSFSSWIYRISHNEAIDHIRSARKRKTMPLELDEEESKSLIHFLKSEIDLAKEFEQKEMVRKIQKAISMLSPKFREVLILRYIEDLNYNEIADILKMPNGTVGTLVNRAKKQFKQIAIKLNVTN